MMMERSNILSNDPDWKISVRVRGPTGTISKKLQKKTTSVHPNKGITLHEVLNQLAVHVTVYSIHKNQNHETTMLIHFQ